MLVSRRDFLDVQHLYYSVTNLPKDEIHLAEFSTNGTYIVTVLHHGQRITITNLHRNSWQFIDTELEVHRLTLIGNTLLVEGADVLVAWRLTAEGTVDGSPAIGRADYSNSLWTKPLGRDIPQLWVKGNFGIIGLSKEHIVYYDTETGEEFEGTNYLDLCYNNPLSRQTPNQASPMLQCHRFLENDPQVSIPWYKEGWVICPEGEHQHWFWLPVHWRPDWLGGVTTLRLRVNSGMVIIKF